MDTTDTGVCGRELERRLRAAGIVGAVVRGWREVPDATCLNDGLSLPDEKRNRLPTRVPYRWDNRKARRSAGASTS